MWYIVLTANIKTTYTIHTLSVIRHANKMNNLDDMDKYLETQTLSKLNYEKIEILNKSISSREIELVIRNLTTKGSGPDGFIGKHLKKN